MISSHKVSLNLIGCLHQGNQPASFQEVLRLIYSILNCFFTSSRSEFRLSLRAENADMRLTEIGISIGLINSAHALAFQRKSSLIASGMKNL